MTKFYCDRCNAEVNHDNDLIIVAIPEEMKRYDYTVRRLAVCKKCSNEYDNITTFLTEVRFAAFKHFMGDVYVSKTSKE